MKMKVIMSAMFTIMFLVLSSYLEICAAFSFTHLRQFLHPYRAITVTYKEPFALNQKLRLQSLQDKKEEETVPGLRKPIPPKQEWELRQEWQLEDAIKANYLSLSGGQVFVSWELVRDSCSDLKQWTPTQLEMKWKELAQNKGLSVPVTLPVLEYWDCSEAGVWSGLVYARACGGTGPSITTIPRIERELGTADGKVRVIELPSGQAYELGIPKEKEAPKVSDQETEQSGPLSALRKVLSKATLVLVLGAIMRLLFSFLVDDGTTYYMESSSYSYTQVRQEDGSIKRTGSSSSEVRTNIKGLENYTPTNRLFQFDD